MSLRAYGAGEPTAAYPLSWQGSGALAASAELPPVRPALSPALSVLLCVWAAVVLADAACLEARTGALWLGCDPRLAVCAGAGLAVVGALAAARVFPGVQAVLLLGSLGLAAGMAAGTLSVETTLARGDQLQTNAVSAYRYLVETDPQPTASGGWRFEALVLAGGGEAGRVWVDVACSVGRDASGTPDLPGMGSVVELVGRWKPFDLNEEFDASLVGRGVCARLSAMQVELVGRQGGLVGAVRSVRFAMLGAVEPYSTPARALTAGVVCGMQAALAAFDSSEEFSRLGLSHLVAVSGSHLALVAALLGALLGRTRARPAGRCGCLAAALALYVAFTGFQPSAVRSWVMASFALAATVAGRRAHAVSAVSVAALGMLLLEPSNAQNMGFTLSVLSVLGLTVFAGLGQAWVREALPARTPRFVGESLALTCISQAFTMPVSLPAFGNLALLAPLANVLVGPLVSALLVVGLACVPLAALAPAWAVGAAMLPCDVLAGASCALAGWMAGIPGTAIMLEAGAPLLGAGLLLGSCALYALWPAPSRRVLWAVLAVFAGFLGCCVLYWRFLAPPRVVVLDVGQGDAILVQDGPHALLVDTGPGDAVCYALARTCVPYLDAVVLTHTDSDHAGGLEELASQVGVGCLAVAWGVPDAVERNEPRAWESIEGVGAPVVELDAGDVLAVGRFDLEVLWPLEPVEGDENEDSLVMLLTYTSREGGGPTFSALLTGDAEAPVLDALLVREEIGPVDLLKLGHHGSAASTSESMLDILDPLVAVASAGANNRYGHPSQECVEVCEKAGVPLLCTAQTGDVAFYMEGDSVRMVLENAA